MSGEKSQQDLEALLAEREYKEFVEDVNNQIYLVTLFYPQYTLDQVIDMSIGDRSKLFSTAMYWNAAQDARQLSIMAASKGKQSYKSQLRSLQAEMKKYK